MIAELARDERGRELCKRTRFVSKYGPKRGEGDWCLLFLCSLLAREPDWTEFCDRCERERLWEACGFSHAPEYDLMRLRFIELEEHWEAFADVGMDFVADAAMRVEGLLDVVVPDATPVLSGRVPQHDCLDPVKCAHLKGRPPARVGVSS